MYRNQYRCTLKLIFWLYRINTAVYANSQRSNSFHIATFRIQFSETFAQYRVALSARNSTRFFIDLHMIPCLETVCTQSAAFHIRHFNLII